MKILSVVGARPNFMKIAPFVREIVTYNSSPYLPDYPTIDHILVHTGQHYDDKMSRAFFATLDIPEADINLGIGSGSHALQVGQTMIAFEQVLHQEKPDWVVVVGDVNATLACSITARKELVKCCHIEAGLRSGDMTMPEEVNRLVTDRLADLLLTPDQLSADNLRKEGITEDKIRFVGNIMIDTLERNRAKAAQLDLTEIVKCNLLPGVNRLVPLSGDYSVITLHRPSNVDHPEILQNLIDFLCDEVCLDMPLVWPVHPRTEHNLVKFGLIAKVSATPNMILLSPVGYHEMLRLNMTARMMLTDSGGLQEECCVLGTPCLTLRWNTERPVTLRDNGGASVLVGNNVDLIREHYRANFCRHRLPRRPNLWDGKTAQRCLEAILEHSSLV